LLSLIGVGARCLMASLPPPAAADAPAGSGGNVIAQLVAPDGSATGPQLDLPADVMPSQLEELLNGLLRSEERTPYAFYAAGGELPGSLGEHLAKAVASVEGVLRITYQARPAAASQPAAAHARPAAASPLPRRARHALLLRPGLSPDAILKCHYRPTGGTSPLNCLMKMVS
jgi:hypothetical protein